MTLELDKHVSATETESGITLLDERSGTYWQMNHSGAVVLRALLNGTASHDVTKLLTDRYEVTDQQASQDVEALVTRLRAAQLVR
jgi:hypothetical protein